MSSVARIRFRVGEGSKGYGIGWCNFRSITIRGMWKENQRCKGLKRKACHGNSLGQECRQSTLLEVHKKCLYLN